MTKHFYVCSYGGCGSKMLCNALKKHGSVRHIHSRNPPNNLQYIGSEKGGKSYAEWFNGINIPDSDISNYYVIYLYRNPVNSILSKFYIKNHLKHIQIDKNIKIEDVIEKSIDLYEINNFYNNYTKENPDRNYKIYAVKYEEIFEKQDELSEILGIEKLNIVKKSTKKNKDEEVINNLGIIYKDLIEKMNNNPFLMIK